MFHSAMYSNLVGRSLLLVLWLAMAPAFGGLETLYLTDTEKSRVEEALGAKLRSAVVRRRSEGESLVYLDRHKVRTLPETLGIHVGVDGKVSKIEILAFAEPKVYKPRPKWLTQFHGRDAEDLPKYRSDIDGISGATLSGRAVTDAVRRVVLIHRVIKERK